MKSKFDKSHLNKLLYTLNKKNIYICFRIGHLMKNKQIHDHLFGSSKKIILEHCNIMN